MVLAERLWLLFLEIIREVGETLEIDVTGLIEKMIWHKKTENMIYKLLAPGEQFNKAA